MADLPETEALSTAEQSADAENTDTAPESPDADDSPPGGGVHAEQTKDSDGKEAVT